MLLGLTQISSFLHKTVHTLNRKIPTAQRPTKHFILLFTHFPRTFGCIVWYLRHRMYVFNLYAHFSHHFLLQHSSYYLFLLNHQFLPIHVHSYHNSLILRIRIPLSDHLIRRNEFLDKLGKGPRVIKYLFLLRGSQWFLTLYIIFFSINFINETVLYVPWLYLFLLVRPKQQNLPKISFESMEWEKENERGRTSLLPIFCTKPGSKLEECTVICT